MAKKEIKIRSIFDDSEDHGLDCRELDHKSGEYKYVTRTKQSDKEACDINNILRRYEKTGELPTLIRDNPRYGDFSSVPSYQESLEIVSRAEEQFMALSAKVRDRFDNDPVKMLAFVADPANKQELVDLGLALPPAAAPDTKSAKSGVQAPEAPAQAGA